ncbi:MAG: cysteine--tRNA ligase [Thermomicrobia bacterium]|nr:cysteine--tRNA ligase [Thermomicrobia bacterium]
MNLRLYNTATQQIAPFTPRDEAVGLYVCGVTPYDTTHMGHAFTYVVFDTLARVLRRAGWAVTYVQNVTDIDDDILKRARETGKEWDELGREQTAQYETDSRALNIAPPTHFLRATDEIDQMIPLIATLIAKGHAYTAGGNVYFSVASDPEYGTLSRYSREEMAKIAAERGGKVDDPAKRDPLDFLLWQAEQPGEPAWESPWGRGRPGWHIECSAMAMHFLGPTVDIHGGGADLIFPHHESEIAQSECATGVHPFVRVWMHTAMVRYDGEKMSKSLGNMVFVRDALTQYDPDAIRLYLLDHHYRTPWEYEDDGPATFLPLVQRAREALGQSGGSDMPVDAAPFLADFDRALENDLDTPAAIAAFRSLVVAIADARNHGVAESQAALRAMVGTLGLRLGEP